MTNNKAATSGRKRALPLRVDGLDPQPDFDPLDGGRPGLGIAFPVQDFDLEPAPVLRRK